MVRTFDENTRVKIPATIQFMRLGYNYVSLKDADRHDGTNIFIEIFKNSIERLNNRKFSEEEIYELISDIHRVIQNNDLGKEFYTWLMNPMDKPKLIDFDKIENNNFSVVNELTFGKYEGERFRPDINILINGIPISFIEVKPPNNIGTIQAEFNRMLNERLKNETVKKHFNMLQIVSFSNNMDYEDGNDYSPAEEIKAGSFYTTPNGQQTFFSFFREEENLPLAPYVIDDNVISEVIEDNNYPLSLRDTPEFKTNLDPLSPCNSFITSMYTKDRLMFLLQYGIMYIDSEVPQKHIMRYPQFFACRRILDKLESGEKSGIIWHTQGSGKTALSAYANRVIRDYYAKKGIVARFYFVVDRLDLLRQAVSEFSMRGFDVEQVEGKREFQTALNRTAPKITKMDATGEFCVVNIQKFSENPPIAENDYNAKIQRVIFIDEAHRSYSLKGQFFANLLTVDSDANFIALTGTPLLSKSERSNLKFGDYIHKYFYDKSILDGYTLRIKKEQIETVARTQIKHNIELEDPSAKDAEKAIWISDQIIASLGKYIAQDFIGFRFAHNDSSIGGMVVCSSNKQAQLLFEWLNSNSELTVKVVISTDESEGQFYSSISERNKEAQYDFKHTNQPDLLIVHRMLTTGYDVPRLKKMYMLRNAREHTLLQTISRVNRPYRNSNGKRYEYGYIVDFVDIEEEYDKAIESYINELEGDFSDGDEPYTLKGLVVSAEDVYKRYQEYIHHLSTLVNELTNLELFSQEIRKKERGELYTLRQVLNGIKNCYTEFKLSLSKQYEYLIDIEKIRLLIKEVENRIKLLNIKTRPTDTLEILNNQNVVTIVYEFIKYNVQVINLGEVSNGHDGMTANVRKKVEEIQNNVNKIRNEINRNVNKTQEQLVLFDAFLSDIFTRLDIANIEDLSDINEDLYKAYQEIFSINNENDRLAAVYNGKYSYVKTYQDITSEYKELNVDEVEQMLLVISEIISEILVTNNLIKYSRTNFINSIKKNVTHQLIKKGLYKSLNLKEIFTYVLSQVYTNLHAYKELEC